MHDIHQDKILVIDFGSQYTQLIARRIRELGVYCEIKPFDASSTTIENFRPAGIILSGGPSSACDTPKGLIPPVIFKLNVPVLGICFGMQAMAQAFNGNVKAASKRQFGYAELKIEQSDSKLFEGLETEYPDKALKSIQVWMSHGDQVLGLPSGFKALGRSDNAPIAAMENPKQALYGVQFHPEVTHTPQGRTILNNFIFKICHCRDLWHSGYIIENLITQIRSQVGKQEVILGLSGGVDSSVVAALLYEAIGAQLTCVFVDTGLLRLNEAEEIMQQFADHMKIKVIRVDAQKRFEKALEGIFDPERKRKIIGNLFVKIFEEQASKIENAKWLAQGTIYPDIIESAGDSSKSAHVIKSHHNVGGLPEDMNLKLLEPLTELFKDEVRHIGYQLGLPYRMVYRHPFPGPGLGVRILGEIKLVYADMLRQADAIYIQELENAGWYDRVSQAFAVFLPVKSVGVVGDQRQYEYVIVLRAVETVDFMTARWAKLPYAFLERVSHRIVNEVNGISRVTYDITGKPPATVEWE